MSVNNSKDDLIRIDFLNLWSKTLNIELDCLNKRYLNAKIVVYKHIIRIKNRPSTKRRKKEIITFNF